MKLFIIVLLLSSCATTNKTSTQENKTSTQEEMCGYCDNERTKCLSHAESKEDEYRCKIEWKQCIVDCGGRKYA